MGHNMDSFQIWTQTRIAPHRTHVVPAGTHQCFPPAGIPCLPVSSAQRREADRRVRAASAGDEIVALDVFEAAQTAGEPVTMAPVKRRSRRAARAPAALLLGGDCG